MTLREQRAIVYPPNYNYLQDEWYIWESEKTKRKITFLLGLALLGYILRHIKNLIFKR